MEVPEEIITKEANPTPNGDSAIIPPKEPETTQAPETSNNEEITKNRGEETVKEDPKAQEVMNFKLTFGKKVHDITFDSNAPLKRLKEHIEGLTGVPSSMQKLMWKGMLKDDELPISQTQLKEGAKVMLVGSTVSDVIQVNTLATTTSSSSSSSTATEKAKTFCEQTEHKKIIDKGRPEDGIIGKKGTKSSITNGFSLHGMLNKMASKVRLTFKTDVEQLWIATNERTEKIQFNSIQQIVSEPITGQEDYHIMGFQLGPTEKSRYFVYFVPAQYVESIKDCVLGGFQYF